MAQIAITGRPMKCQHNVRLVIVLMFNLSLLFAAPMFSKAATITVTSTGDSGAGSLRSAIATAASGDIVTFALATPTTISVTNGELVVTNNLTIAGPGASNLALSGGGS